MDDLLEPSEGDVVRRGRLLEVRSGAILWPACFKCGREDDLRQCHARLIAPGLAPPAGGLRTGIAAGFGILRQAHEMDMAGQLDYFLCPHHARMARLRWLWIVFAALAAATIVLLGHYMNTNQKRAADLSLIAACVFVGIALLTAITFRPLRVVNRSGDWFTIDGAHDRFLAAWSGHGDNTELRQSPNGKL